MADKNMLTLQIENNKDKSFSVKLTQAVEREIIKRLATEILASGHSVAVNNGEEEVLKPARWSARAVINACCTTDDETLVVYFAGKQIGWISLIYGNGNNGLDLISDYTTSLEDLIKPVTEWIKTLD